MAEGEEVAAQATFNEETGSFVCNHCGGTFQSEKAVWGHIGRAHRGMKLSSTKMREGEEWEPVKTEMDAQGFNVQSESNRPLSQMGTLRRILDNNGIKTSRETIIELFEKKDPRDLKALARLLSLADIGTSKKSLILEAWKNYVESVAGPFSFDTPVMAEEDQFDFNKPLKPKKNPLTMSPEEMVDWSPMDWARYSMEMQKLATATRLQQAAMKSIYAQMGLADDNPGSQAKLPADVQARLDRLAQLEENERLQKQMEPLVQKLNELKAEKKTGGGMGMGMDDIKELALGMKFMEAMGSDKGADTLRAQLEAKLEQQKIASEEKVKTAQMQMDQARENNRTLELKNMEANMKGEIQRLQTLYEVANTEKKKDLIQTINEAKSIVDTMKGISGDTGQSADDKKMEAIANIANSAMQTMKPVLSEIARNWGGGGGGRPGGYPQPMPQQQYGGGRQPTGPMSGPRVMAQCTTPNCGAEFAVDPNQKSVECPKCHTIYDIQPMQAAPGSAPQQPQQQSPQQLPTMSGGQGSLQQRRQALLGMERKELDAAAKSMGIEPNLYNSSEALVEEMLAHAFGTSG